VQNLIDEWRKNLKSEVRELFPNSISINFHLECFNESLASRVIELSTMALRCFEDKDFLEASLATRSIVETMAVQFRLKTILGADEFVDVELFKKVALGGCFNESPVEQVNIMTLLKKLNKEYPGTLEFHECLSELSHPNMFGVLGHYCVQDFSAGLAKFNNHPPEELFKPFADNLKKTIGSSFRIYNDCCQLLGSKIFNKEFESQSLHNGALNGGAN